MFGNRIGYLQSYQQAVVCLLRKKSTELPSNWFSTCLAGILQSILDTRSCILNQSGVWMSGSWCHHADSASWEWRSVCVVAQTWNTAPTAAEIRSAWRTAWRKWSLCMCGKHPVKADWIILLFWCSKPRSARECYTAIKKDPFFTTPTTKHSVF